MHKPIRVLIVDDDIVARQGLRLMLSGADDADIEPPPAFGARIRNDFIVGMGKINGKFVILLDIGQVFAGCAGELAAEPAAG